MLDLWYSAYSPSIESHLSAQEQARCQRFLFAKDRRAYAMAHTWKRLILSQYAPQTLPDEWTFQTRGYGKPYAEGKWDWPQFEFNLSHSGQALAIAVSDQDVGVDIECIRPIKGLEGLARSVLHPDELAWLKAQGNRLEDFFLLWTLKEAVLKADGLGFHRQPRDFALRRLPCRNLEQSRQLTGSTEETDGTGQGAEPWISLTSLDGQDWRCFSYRMPEHVVSLAILDCIETQVPNLRCIDDELPRFPAAGRTDLAPETFHL